jgi:hypothetical protein
MEYYIYHWNVLWYNNIRGKNDILGVGRMQDFMKVLIATKHNERMQQVKIKVIIEELESRLRVYQGLNEISSQDTILARISELEMTIQMIKTVGSVN